MNRFRQVLFALLLCACLPTYAQRITDNGLKTLIKSTINAYEKKPYEKVYVQTDKPAYFPGDTIRFKTYLLNGDYRGASVLSSILYIELANEAGKMAKRIMLPVNDGLAWADMPLDTADVKQGHYTLRAYTNWMRNFGEDYIFKKNITISKRLDNPLLVNSVFRRADNKVEGELQIKQLDGKLLALKDAEVRLMNGKKNLSKDKLTTGIDGKLTLNFVLPENNNPITIKVLMGGNEVTVPVNL
ncbi:MAG: MG2 domain-containing protein, partial [Mucilaginibacter sp.]